MLSLLLGLNLVQTNAPATWPELRKAMYEEYRTQENYVDQWTLLSEGEPTMRFRRIRDLQRRRFEAEAKLYYRVLGC